MKGDQYLLHRGACMDLLWCIMYLLLCINIHIRNFCRRHEYVFSLFYIVYTMPCSHWHDVMNNDLGIHGSLKYLPTASSSYLVLVISTIDIVKNGLENSDAGVIYQAWSYQLCNALSCHVPVQHYWLHDSISILFDRGMIQLAHFSFCLYG